MTSQPGKQTIAIHILSHISRSWGNETITFCQLIEKFFLENLCRKYGGENSLRPFLKDKIESISGSIL